MTNNILIVGPAWVGDMVMAQCLFKLLKQNHPHAQLDVLAPAWSLPLLSRMPEVNKAISMNIAHGQLALRERYVIGKNLRQVNYQQAIVLPNSFKSAFIPWWAKIPQRTGWRGEMRYIVLNDMRLLDKNRYPLMIERFMALGLPAGSALPKDYPKPRLSISIASQQNALKKYGLTKDQPVLALCPGAEFGPAKRWPEKYYAEVAKAKLKLGYQVWLFGSPKDQPTAEHIMQLTQHRCINLTGKTTLADAIDLLSLSTMVVANDSGLMHITAALGKPMVAVYGPTSSKFTPPLDDHSRVLSLSLDCQPCFQRECPLGHGQCMVGLSPDKVITALDELI